LRRRAKRPATAAKTRPTAANAALDGSLTKFTPEADADAGLAVRPVRALAISNASAAVRL
jgi:hypothetical protein